MYGIPATILLETYKFKPLNIYILEQCESARQQQQCTRCTQCAYAGTEHCCMQYTSQNYEASQELTTPAGLSASLRSAYSTLAEKEGLIRLSR